MSKRHTLGVSKWLPSTEDKITFKITLRPSTPNIDDDVFLKQGRMYGLTLKYGTLLYKEEHVMISTFRKRAILSTQ